MSKVGFSRAEQLLLLRAFRNEAGTDEELAAALKVSMPTVKKMWLSIYRRAAGLPELAPDGGEPGHDPAVGERRSAAAFWPICATIQKSCALSRERPSRQEASRRRASSTPPQLRSSRKPAPSAEATSSPARGLPLSSFSCENRPARIPHFVIGRLP
jgi:hypothetical protein